MISIHHVEVGVGISEGIREDRPSEGEDYGRTVKTALSIRSLGDLRAPPTRRVSSFRGGRGADLPPPGEDLPPKISPPVL